MYIYIYINTHNIDTRTLRLQKRAAALAGQPVRSAPLMSLPLILALLTSLLLVSCVMNNVSQLDVTNIIVMS